MKTFSSPQIKNTQTTQSEKLYIIAIGASAGGLEAINRIFDNTPKAGVAYVIVQHLSPDHESFMAISVAETDMLLEPNQIYLLPKGKNMTVKNGRLVLTDSQDKQPNSAIDIFFDSLAEDQGDKSIAVILSGMGRDGTKGIEAIKKQGGFVIVQDPDTAQFDSMPNSAIHSGNVDAILAPELIPEEIIAYVKWEQLEINIGNRISKSNEDKLTKILNLIQLHTPLDFSGYKRPTIIRKIIIRMARNDIKSLEDYITFLDNNHNEIITLAQGFLISVTKFFRDKDAFEVIRKNLLPEIIKNKLQIDTLKVWVIGCATGEEAYSLAILIREELNTLHSGLMVKIFASDIDKPALLKASKGIYDRSIEDEVSEERLNKFFIKLGNKATTLWQNGFDKLPQPIDLYRAPFAETNSQFASFLFEYGWLLVFRAK